MEEILASIRRIIADDQDGARQASARAPEPAPEPDDVLDLADLEPPLPAARLDFEHEDVSFRDADNQIDFDAIPIDDEPEPEPFFEPAPPPPPPPRAAPAAPPPPAPDSLLSNATAASAAGAFQMLSSTVLSSHPRTIEDLVQDMLRPMLKAWLDENLPPMVERLVRAEIERVSRLGR
jgi:cell pole-organizing protein PopZ